MKNPYLSLLSTAWRYAKEDKKLYIGIYLLFIGANLTAAINPFFYGWFVDSVQENGADVISQVWIYGLGFLFLKLLEWAFHGPARVMERKLAFKVSQNFLDEQYNKLVHLPVSWHKENHSGSTINRLRKAYTALKDFFQNGFIYLASMLKFITAFIAMFYFSPLFGCVAAVLGILTIGVIMKFDKPFVKSLKEVNEADHAMSSNLFDSLSNIMTVITLRLEQRVHVGLMEKVRAVFPPFKKNAKINEWKWFAAQMLVALIYVVMVVGYVYQNYTPGIAFKLGGLVTLLGFVNQFTSVFNDFASQYTQIVQYNTDVETAKVFETAFEENRRTEKTTALPEDWNNLAIRNLSYKHPQKGNAASVVNSQGVLDPSHLLKKPAGLKKLNLDIKRGQRIALIGESGCGKSTLLTLLRGLNQPSAGTMMEVDGRPGMGFDNISDSVTLLPQEPEIFEASFEYNVTMGLPFEKEEVERVCELTRLSVVLNDMEEGIQTRIIEKGQNLSGGQKQRLALARGVLASKSSSIVLMDEPTSSMDPKTEQEIYLNMFREFEGKTVISTLHRLHLLKHFDYIYVMNKGKIVEEGTLQSLFENGEMFNKLWNHQKNDLKESIS
ncbi:ABC transporter ATP-binding protein [Rubrolithibacter danxiaensis]|uniref:ABC transporter ATP-binding protein n=1 Tax=Rubrolithibacter danxiaensis TaxID=3390805 RepID=UPI003BF79936